MEIFLYSLVGTVMLLYGFNAFRFYRSTYKGKIFKDIYSGFIEFWYRYNIRNNASESSYIKNQLGTHKIVYNSYLNEKYEPIHQFITVYTLKGVLVCYINGSTGDVSGKDSDKYLVVRRDGKAYRIPGTKDVVEKHLKTIRSTVTENTLVDMCYFFKNDTTYERFKTSYKAASYKEFMDVLKTLDGHMSAEGISESYDMATSHLLKEKK
ncbi:MAG: hypothetical protein Q4D13_08570 [Erysipelotrichaceae bacterium]|nr:hypothetical protein [Erysipelotrichaceae bacterium]